MSKYYWLNKKSRDFLSRGYIRENQTVEERIREIAEAAEKYLGVAGYADRFEDYMSRGWYSLSSPVWANYGLERGLPVSCNGSFINDTMDSILTKTAEIGFMTKLGAGTSAYFGSLRPRGAKISTGGESSGPVHFMELFDTTIEVISQSNIRRGSMAAYLPVDHPDILDFLKIKGEGHKIQNLSIGVCISDEWMRGLLNKDKDKLKVWAAIIKKRFESGYPYLFFIDNANNGAPKVYKEKNKKIHASNLCCVSGSDRVVTSRGLLTAKELYELNEPLMVFDGENPVQSSEMKLISPAEKVYKITLSNGLSHTVTKCHKLPVRQKRKMINTELVYEYINTRCEDLKIDDIIKIQSSEGLFGNTSMEDEAFLLGLYQADGTQDKRNIHLCLWENDFDLIEEVQNKFNTLYQKYNGDQYINFDRMKVKTHQPKFVDQNTGFSKVAKKSLISPFLKRCLNFEKGIIPNWIWTGTKETQWQYIKGLFYADGTVNICEAAKGEPLYLSLCNINKEFLENIQKILYNLGITCSLALMKKAGEALLPDGKGGSKLYKTKDAYRLTCGNKNAARIFEENTGFLSRKGIILSEKIYRDNTKKHFKIVSIEEVGVEPVYCVEVYTDDHLWTVNGIVTHNSEIMLPSSEDESFVCVLSSMNLLHYDEWKDTNAVEILTIFLDTVTTEYINKTENISYMGPAHNFAKRHRAVGLGVLGWHSLLQSKMIPFESMEAKYLNSEIFQNINIRSLAASQELASMYGEPELMVGTGERMATRIAIAPTKSSSFILGQVSQGIEPLDSNYFVDKLAKGSFTYKNPELKKLLKEKDQDTPEVWKSILDNGGSVAHLKFLSDKEKSVFKTFAEISQKEIVIQAAQRQKYIDQGQSLNLMIHPKTPPKEVSQLLIFGWESGVKGFYYHKGMNPAALLSQSINSCTNCEA